MVHGYHVILPAYGFWLPNDPRGSWSEAVRKWELVRFGPTTKLHDRRSLLDLAPWEIASRQESRNALAYPPVTLTGRQAAAVGRGFATTSAASNYTIWACSILPEHTHLVIARHSYGVEQVVILLKGAATRQVLKENCHPFAAHSQQGKRLPRMWAEHQWKVYLNSEESIQDAVDYVEENPIKEGKPKQSWSFVKPFPGITKGGWITYH